MRIAVPDLVSNSYFPAVAAIDLGFFQAQGIDAELEMVFPVGRAMEALRDRRIDFVAGPAHATLSAFPGWQGAKLLAALSIKDGEKLYRVGGRSPSLGCRRSGEMSA